MRHKMINAMKEALSFPVYVFTKSPTGYVVDKIMENEDNPNNFLRDRYLTIGTSQCTCLGYAKTGNCKHLKMLNDDDSWIDKGVPSELLLDEVNRLIAFCSKAFPESSENWRDLVSTPSDLPELVKQITLTITDAGNANKMALLCARSDFETLGDLGIRIAIEKTS